MVTLEFQYSHIGTQITKQAKFFKVLFMNGVYRPVFDVTGAFLLKKFITKMTTMIGEFMQFRHYQRFRIRYIITIYDIQRSFLNSFQHNV